MSSNRNCFLFFAKAAIKADECHSLSERFKSMPEIWGDDRYTPISEQAKMERKLHDELYEQLRVCNQESGDLLKQYESCMKNS